MKDMSKLHYIEYPVICTRCHKEQSVHVHAREKAGQAVQETVMCVGCGMPFEVMLPDKIVSGEFLPG